ncbi:hypothetical protein LMH66_04435 [Shewanella sp. 10N.7]|uniref:hypothetical protein n=1 Tax=Shewanella sp. 10N.7 TaxID=2885093 RepID=UPI001E4C51AE|nr:hypothetical protein [Shewanella sp. 10N.7]MCC4831869.1 hypothetical protein [Shewanella sp. 10N.7]
MEITHSHINLHASQSYVVNTLLTDVLGLKSGHRPNFPFNGEWLYQDDKALIHIIESNNLQQCTFDHIAFDTDMSLKNLTQKLQQNALKYNIRQFPDSNTIQDFVRVGEVELVPLETSSQQHLNVYSQLQELL